MSRKVGGQWSSSPWAGHTHSFGVGTRFDAAPAAATTAAALTPSIPLSRRRPNNITGSPGSPGKRANRVGLLRRAEADRVVFPQWWHSRRMIPSLLRARGKPWRLRRRIVAPTRRFNAPPEDTSTGRRPGRRTPPAEAQAPGPDQRPSASATRKPSGSRYGRHRSGGSP